MSASKWRPYPVEYTTEFRQWARLPSHWKETNLGKLSSKITDGSHHSPETQDEGENYISVKDITKWGQIDFKNCKKISSEDFKQLSNEGNQPKVGSLLITKDGTIGRAAIVDESNNFVILSSVGLIEPNESKILVSFLRYFLISQVGISQMYSMIAGSALTRLTVEKINWLRAPVPLLKEQEKIISFIDKAEKDFKQLFDLLESQIELLNEKRSSLITQAVTKGLDPDVPMKDSGIDTIGIIPEHWKISRLKYHSDINGRIGFRGYNVSDLVDRDEGALSLGATHISPSGEIDLEKPVYLSWQKYYESPEIMLSKGDILTVQRGSTCGKIGLIANDLGPATINPSLVVIKNTAIDSKFMFYLLKSEGIQNLFNSILGTTAIPMISQEQIGEIPICIPPPEEVKEISDYLSSQILLANEVESKTKNYINILNEYRIALISATVTGKIDVRGLA